MAYDVQFSPLERMMKGLNVACDAAGGTLGPRGRNVYIDDAMVPKITNDGHTIVSHIELPDKVENMGIKIVKSSCARTVDEAGDGTTTTAVLLQAIMKECMKRPENPMVIRKSLLDALPGIIGQIGKSSKKIDKKDIRKVALISSEDTVLADAISDILNKVGKEAIVTIEDALDNTTSYETIEGYEAHVGFLSPHFVNEQNRARCVMKNVPVLVTERKISAIGDIKGIFDQFANSGISECVIVCEDIDNAILGQLVINKLRGGFSCCVIRAVGDVLKDIEACVGAIRVSESTGVSFQNVTLKHLGKCKKVVSDNSRTLFIPENTGKSKTYANILKKAAAEEHNQFIASRMMKRASQMSGGVALLKIGSPDFNREYLKDKADDAIKACKAALEEGVVEGGGMCLYRISEAMKPASVGEEILKRALTAPLRKIIENAGQDYAEIVKDIPLGFGYDAKNDSYVHMMLSGIIDPTKVERCSLTNAVMNASNLFTAHASISEYVEPKSA